MGQQSLQYAQTAISAWSGIIQNWLVQPNSYITIPLYDGPLGFIPNPRTETFITGINILVFFITDSIYNGNFSAAPWSPLYGSSTVPGKNSSGNRKSETGRCKREISRNAPLELRIHHMTKFQRNRPTYNTMAGTDLNFFLETRPISILRRLQKWSKILYDK